MEELRFSIRHADGRHESTAARAARIVIGSGAHCDVRLSADQAAFEHVVIEQQPTGMVLRSLAVAPPAMVDGVPLTAVQLEGSATLRIAATEVHVTRAVLAPAAKPSAIGPAIIAKVAVIALLFVAIFFVSKMDSEHPIAEAPKTPELFAKAAAECPRTELAEARVVADDQRAIADGARERSPFDPREARSAVKSYEIAAACYRLAQLSDASEEAAQSARRMREETTLDFRARRVRLERVLLVKDYEVASQDIAVLRALTEGQQDEYARWLTTVAREIKNQKVETQ
jgi:hypothetical protein